MDNIGPFIVITVIIGMLIICIPPAKKEDKTAYVSGTKITYKGKEISLHEMLERDLTPVRVPRKETHTKDKGQLR